MPRYEYKCEKCEYEFILFNKVKYRNRQKCIKCRGSTIRPITRNLALIDPWKPITLEHIDDQPRHFETKKQLQAFCKKKGYESGALL